MEWLVLVATLALMTAAEERALVIDVTDDQPTAPDGSEDDDSPNEGPTFVQGYVFVVVVALVLFCGCACLSANGLQGAEASGASGHQSGRESPQNDDHSRLDQRSFALLRDSLVESGESQWICFVCAFENKPRARACALCGASVELTRAFDDRLRVSKHGIMSTAASTTSVVSSPRSSASDQLVSNGNNCADMPLGPSAVDEVAVAAAATAAETTAVFPSARNNDIATTSPNRASVRVDQCSVLPNEPTSIYHQRQRSGLDATSRAQSFVIGRLNELTLRQKGAARRRIWRRQRVASGWRWVREDALALSPSASVAYVTRLDDRDDDSDRADIRWSVVEPSSPPDDEGATGPRRRFDSNNAEAVVENGEHAVESCNDDHSGPTPRDQSSPPSMFSFCCCICCLSQTEERRSSSALWCCSGFIEGTASSSFWETSWNSRCGLRLRFLLPASAPNNCRSEDDDDLEAIAALPFREKQVWFERRIVKRGSVRPLTIEVRRNNALADSIRRFENASLWRLANAPLRVRFRGEVAIDAGGVVREWFEVVARALFEATDIGVFESKPEAGYAANIHPASGDAYFDAKRHTKLGLSIDHLRIFRFAGRFVAKALRDQIPLPVTLALPLLKHVLAVPLSFSDLEFVDADAFQSYLWLRNNDGAEALALSFAIAVRKPAGGPDVTDSGGGEFHDSEGSRIETVDLIENGRNLDVTDANKAQFLALVLKYKVLDGIRPQLGAFLRGFDDILDRNSLAVFDYQELQLMIGGLADIDVDDWKRHTRYLGAFANQKERHPVVAMFWRCIEEEFDQTDRARLCQFCTGASQLPPSGFKALVGDDGRYCNFTLASLPRGLGVWPRAHTCFNRLDLPLYKSFEELHSYLSLTIHLEVVGFTME
mmetsp:Transcript_28856/g.92947  ORF Transcript_28856/g.92947 Transcript_28856/m.92947 type:complete len:887 (+) Transcript_28856:159-2819(+)